MIPQLDNSTSNISPSSIYQTSPQRYETRKTVQIQAPKLLEAVVFQPSLGTTDFRILVYNVEIISKRMMSAFRLTPNMSIFYILVV